MSTSRLARSRPRAASVATGVALSCALGLAACGGSSDGAGSASVETSSAGTSSASSGEETTSTGGEATSRSTSPAADTGTGPAADLQQYASRVMAQVRRHWQIPAALSPSESALLEASIQITIDEATRRPTGYRIVEASGNAVFDESVMRGLQALVDAGEPLSEPPTGLDDRSSVRLRLRGHR